MFFREFWTSLPRILSPDWILGQHHAAPWAVLALCFIFLVAKRKEVLKSHDNKHRILFFILGLILIISAILMPASEDFLVFQVLLASLGVFVMIFGRGAKIPSILFIIYGFAISFPLAVQYYAENIYAQTASAPVIAVMSALNYPIQNNGNMLHFVSTGGEPIRVAITAACAGPSTMALFIAIFSLMVMDRPLKVKRTVSFFLFGLVGTWFQNIIRLVIIIMAGYYLGERALLTAHFWTIYALFPLWYLIYAFLYMKQHNHSSLSSRVQESRLALATLRFKDGTG